LRVVQRLVVSELFGQRIQHAESVGRGREVC
jgi:hypothetical protein